MTVFTKESLITHETELRELMPLFIENRETYEPILKDYGECIRNMSVFDQNWHWEQSLIIQEQLDLIEKQLPNVTDEEFDKYTCLLDILAILLE